MIVKVVERQFTWKDTGRPHIQYNVYYSNDRSEHEYRNGRPRSFGPRMITTKYPWNFCLHRSYVGGELPMTVLRFILTDSDDVKVETEYKECNHSMSGTAKQTTYTLARCYGGTTEVVQSLARPALTSMLN